MPEPLGSPFALRVLVPILAPVVRGAGASVVRFFKAEGRLPARKTVAEISSWLEETLPRLLDDDVDAAGVTGYIRSPECATLLEHMFSFRLSGRPLGHDGPLSQELSVGLDVHQLALTTGDRATLFKVFQTVVDYALGADIQAEETLSEDSSNRAAATAIESYLQSIDARISELAATSIAFTARDLRDFCNRYRQAILAVDADIQPPSFDGAPSVPIDELYVPPSLTAVDPTSGAEVSYRYDDLATENRIVVLGNPGGGKTTLSKRIACDLARERVRIRRGDEVAIPVIVTLREYGAFVDRRPGSIVEYLVELLASRYQLIVDLRLMDWLLGTGRMSVLFDGLDELLEPSDRRNVVSAISAFSAAYPTAHVLATSRTVGYMLAPLPSSVFRTLTLGDFDEDDVTTYVRNWFAIDRGLSDARRAEIVERFVAESSVVDDLRRNPLMLGLMCSIYRTESYIPRNRPDVYEKCARMLFDRWDRHRGLSRTLEFEAHVEPALMEIAHTIYQSDDLQGGITERHLVDYAAEYLSTWQYTVPGAARRAAREFVEFCRGRAWVFTDVGLTAEGESIYQFTHRTFLEYFTASFLARSCESIADLVTVLAPRIAAAEWDVVAQLALQIKAKSVRGGADRVVSDLLDRARSMPDISEADRTLSFAVRSLEFLVTAPPTSKAIGTEIGRAAVRQKNSELIDAAERSAAEIRELVLCSTGAALRACAADAPGPDRELVVGLAVDVSRNLGQYHMARGLTPSDEADVLERWVEAECSDHWTQWQWAMVRLLQVEEISLQQAVDVYGLTLLFNPPRTPGTTWGYISPAFNALRRRMYPETREEFDAASADLRTYSKLVHENFPFERKEQWDTGCFHWLLDTRFVKPVDVDLPSLQPKDVWEVGLVAAFVLEVALTEWSREEAVNRISEPERWGTLARFAELARPRSNGTLPDRRSDEWGTLLTAWAAGEQDMWSGLSSLAVV